MSAKAWMRRLTWVVPLTLGGVLLGGCQKGLFPEGTPRSPYERYLTLRGDYRPPVEHDAYGVERPALRQRLRPLE
jgi:hypothetical protein